LGGADGLVVFVFFVIGRQLGQEIAELLVHAF
jgi:hypothetical protein